MKTREIIYLSFITVITIGVTCLTYNLNKFAPDSSKTIKVVFSSFYYFFLIACYVLVFFLWSMYYKLANLTESNYSKSKEKILTYFFNKKASEIEDLKIVIHKLNTVNKEIERNLDVFERYLANFVLSKRIYEVLNKDYTEKTVEDTILNSISNENLKSAFKDYFETLADYKKEKIKTKMGEVKSFSEKVKVKFNKELKELDNLFKEQNNILELKNSIVEMKKLYEDENKLEKMLKTINKN